MKSSKIINKYLWFDLSPPNSQKKRLISKNFVLKTNVWFSWLIRFVIKFKLLYFEWQKHLWENLKSPKHSFFKYINERVTHERQRKKTHEKFKLKKVWLTNLAKIIRANNTRMTIRKTKKNWKQGIFQDLHRKITKYNIQAREIIIVKKTIAKQLLFF